MSELQEDYSFQCPYCASDISILVDLTGGRQQTFTTDCEICCRPITITLTLDEMGISIFEANQEGQ